jgi:hypothetical protein
VNVVSAFSCSLEETYKFQAGLYVPAVAVQLDISTSPPWDARVQRIHSTMATTADVLTGLLELDKSSDDFPHILHGMLQSDEYAAFTLALEGHEEIEFLDFLDQGSKTSYCLLPCISDLSIFLQATNAVSADFELHNKCLRSLRRVCGKTLHLPSSYWISSGLVKQHELPIAKGGHADVCKAVESCLT